MMVITITSELDMHPPLKKLNYPLPEIGDLGAFGTKRKYDIHTGIDLYCERQELVYAIEDGTVVAIEAFTGEHADSPWWNNTWAILIEGASGVILYGEVDHCHLTVGDKIQEGQFIGWIEQVLKEDKGVTPTSMLHLEVHQPGTRQSFWWHHGEPMPATLIDPTEFLKRLYAPE